MVKLDTPVGMLVAVALMALYALYGAWIAIGEHSVISAFGSAVAAVACVGTARLKSWSRYLVYLLTAALVGAWLYSLYAAAAVGYFDRYPIRQALWLMAPGALLSMVSCVCAFLVWRHFRAVRRRSGASGTGKPDA